MPLLGKRYPSFIKGIITLSIVSFHLCSSAKVVVNPGCVPQPKKIRFYPQQADLDKKKLEDRGRVEKDKRKYAKLVEDCKQKTERQKIVLAEVVKAQKELILANSKVQFSLPIYFCFVFFNSFFFR